MNFHNNPRGRIRPWPLLLGLLALLAQGQSHADEWFLKWEGAAEEGTSTSSADWIPLTSVTSSVKAPSVNSKTGTINPASLSFQIEKSFDHASALFLQYLATGKSLGRVTLDYLQTQPAATRYRITLEDVFVTSMTQGVSKDASGDSKSEKLTLRFDRMETTCFDLDSRGGSAGGMLARYDQASGQGDVQERLPLRAVITPQISRGGVAVTWPALIGHRYQILVCPALDQPWQVWVEHTAVEDGPATLFLPLAAPMLWLRVVEAD